MITLSICVPTYNRPKYLKECLAAILVSAKGFEDKIEIVVSDNASSEDMAQVVKDFMQKGVSIRYNRNQSNLIDKNFFIAAELAKGQFIWLFSDDDAMEKEAISRVMEKINLGYNLIICNYSILNKDMTQVLKVANYKFTNDINFRDPEKLMGDFGIKLQFISSIVIKKEVFFTVGEPECACFHEYGFSLLFALYSGIRRGLNSVLISKPIIRYRGFNCDGRASVEKWYECFSTGSALVLGALRKKGYSKNAIHSAKHQVLKDYVMHDISFRRLNRERLRSVFNVMLPYYKRHWFFWTVIVPMIFAPRSLVWFARKIVLQAREFKSNFQQIKKISGSSTAMRMRRKNFTRLQNFILAAIFDLLGGVFLLVVYVIKLGKRTPKIKDFRNILLIRLDNIGDVLITIPAIKALRRLYPSAHISCLVNPKSRDVLDGNPNIDEIINFDAPWYHGKSLWWPIKFTQVIKVIKNLRKKDFDLIISFRPGSYHYDHLFSYLIGAPRRVGYGVKGGGFLLTDIVPFEEEKHAIEMALDIVRYLGENEQNSNLDIYISHADKAYADQLLQDNGISSDDLIVGLNPCANHPLIWTVEGFAEVGEALVKRYGAKIVFTGTTDSIKYIENIRNAVSVENISVAGKTNLKQLTALIARFSLLVSVDSAPRFLAYAVGTPVIFLRNGGNSSVIWGPYGKDHYMIKHDVPCAPCGSTKKCRNRECMTGITPEEVLTIVDKVFLSSAKKRLKQEEVNN